MEISKPVKQNLVQIMMNDSQTKELILLNIVKMLNSRGIIDSNHINMYSTIANTNLQSNQNDETFFEVSSDEANRLGTNTKIIRVIIVFNIRLLIMIIFNNTLFKYIYFFYIYK